MGAHTKIEWTDASWTPVRARVWDIQDDGSGKERIGWHCTHVSDGCRNCYAETMNRRLGTGRDYKPGELYREDRKGRDNGEVKPFLDEKMLLAPLRWKKPRMIFVCSMTDLFADFVSDEQIDRVIAVMALCPQHTFQVLTKRADRMRDYCSTIQKNGRWLQMEDVALKLGYEPRGRHDFGFDFISHKQFLPNVWLGVSTERQKEADERIPHLLQTPAAVRFISAEPLLGPIDLTNLGGATMNLNAFTGEASHLLGMKAKTLGGLDWVIVGGESGTGARPMHPDWARSLRDRCAAAGVPMFFKQWGEYLPVGQRLPGYGKIHGATAVSTGRMKLHYGGTPQQHPKHAFAERGVEFASTADDRLTFRVGKKAAGRLLDGQECNGMPEVRR